MNLTTSSGLALKVKNLTFNLSSVFMGSAYCTGFDSLVIGNTLEVSSLSELAECTSGPLFSEISNALDAAATDAADSEAEERAEERAAYRQLCHG